MNKQYIGKIAGLVAVTAIAIGACTNANASLTLNIGLGNSAISGYTGPYATVDVNRTDATHATITFTGLASGGYSFLLGGVDAVVVNVNATSWTLGSLAGIGSNSGTGFTPGGWTDEGSSTVGGGWGTFNQSIKSFDGFTHSSDKIVFTIENTSGTWASHSDVLAANSGGFFAAAHIFVTDTPADASGSAVATGFATTGGPSEVTSVPEPTTMIAGALLLLPLAASTIRILRKNRAA